MSIWDADNLLETNKDYEIINNLSNMVAIGSNMGGEFLGIEFLGKSSYRVVLSPFIDLDKQNYIEIGNSFLDMLIKLDSGVRWFG